MKWTQEGVGKRGSAEQHSVQVNWTAHKKMASTWEKKEKSATIFLFSKKSLGLKRNYCNIFVHLSNRVMWTDDQTIQNLIGFNGRPLSLACARRCCTTSWLLSESMMYLWYGVPLEQYSNKSQTPLSCQNLVSMPTIGRVFLSAM